MKCGGEMANSQYHLSGDMWISLGLLAPFIRVRGLIFTRSHVKIHRSTHSTNKRKSHHA